MAVGQIISRAIAQGAITADDIGALEITHAKLHTDMDLSSKTLTLPATVRGPATLTIDPAVVGDNTGTLVIAGNLQVDGTTTTVNSATLDVADKNITVAKGAANSAAADGAGITIDGASATLTYVDSTGNFTFNKSVDVVGNMELKSSDASSSAGPIIELVRDSASPTAADYLGQIQFKGDDDGGSQQTYAKISSKIVNPTAGSEYGNIEFAVVSNGSNEIVARLKSDGLFLNTGNTIQFEGSTADAHETTLTVADPTADRTITLPNASGTVLLTDGDGSNLTGISSDLVNDTSPQLGGDLDVNGNAIVSASNGNIAITPNGSGEVIIDGLKHPQADGNAGQVLKTDGNGQLAFASVSSLAGAGIQNVSDDSSPQLGGNLDVVTHSIVSTSNRNITLAPNGSGKVVVGTNGIQFGDGTTQTSAGASTGFAIAMGVALG